MSKTKITAETPKPELTNVCEDSTFLTLIQGEYPATVQNKGIMKRANRRYV